MGKSENFYAWTVCVYSFGELVGSLGAGQLTKYIPYRYTIIFSVAMLVVGSLFYALATQGWMLIVARILYGANCGSDYVLITVYLAETSAEVTARRQKNGVKVNEKGKTLKDKLYLWWSFLVNATYPTGLGRYQSLRFLTFPSLLAPAS